MALFDAVQLPDTPAMRPVRLYLEAQDRKDFGNAAEFFADDVVFNGLVLEAKGRDKVAGAMAEFIQGAIEYIKMEAVAEVESGAVSRVLALYWFKLKPAPEPQILCDHITVDKGLITRIDNVFDASKLPPMPG